MTADNGAAQRTSKFAVVGASPAGRCFAARLRSGEAIEGEVRVDRFARLPTPYGLVRFGAAPDHPTIERSPSGSSARTRSAPTTRSRRSWPTTPSASSRPAEDQHPHGVGCVCGREHRALPRMGCSPHAHVPLITYERQDPRR
jgi:hypothetical protein